MTGDSSMSQSSSTSSFNEHPLNDPAVDRLLKRMPPNIASSFSTEQLFGLREAIGVRGGRLHSLDVRSTLKLPFLPFSFYMVFLMGKNRRALSDQERYMAAISLVFFLMLMGFGALAVFFIFLYLAKSALGINLFSDHSIGLWDWFKSQFG